MNRSGIVSQAVVALAVGLQLVADGSSIQAADANDQAQPAVTYTEHVAKILWSRCASCHRPGEVGPFSLLTYNDAAKRAEFLVQVTTERRMPPWFAEPGHGEFMDNARLTDDELATLRNWVAASTPEGDRARLPAPPTFAEGWQLGEPDLILKVSEPFEVSADGRDQFRCFVLPTGVSEDRTVAAVEFRPGNRRVVHHALYVLDRRGAARKLDEADPGPGYKVNRGFGIMPTGSLGGWAPGANALRFPDGMGRMLRAGSDVVLQIHYHPDGKPETDQSEIGIYFTREPAQQIVADMLLMNRQINILPGEERHRVTCSVTLPVDIEAVGIVPHMHYIGREMKTTATLPDGSQVPMVWVKDWNFDWQQQYLYRALVPLPKGTKLDVEAYYDNTSNNPRNPSDPPKLVTFGEQTHNEMCLCSIQYIAKNKEDYAEVRRAEARAIINPFKWVDQLLAPAAAPPGRN